MKCSTVRDELSQYVEGALAGEGRAAIERHLATCPACRAEAEAFRKAEAALRSLATVVPAPDLTADLRWRLAAAQASPRSSRWLWAGAALAAAAAAAAALLVLRAPAPPAPRSGVVRRAVTPEQPRPAPRQLAVEQVTGGGGVDRPTAPPHPSLVLVGPRTSGRDRARRFRRWPAVPGGDTRVPNAERRAPAVPIPDSRSPIPDGVVLLVAAPRPPRPSSSYYGEVTLPDGATSVYEETVQRNAAGEPQSVKVLCQQTAPAPGAKNGG